MTVFIKQWTLFSFLLLILCFLAGAAAAQQFESEYYKVESGNFIFQPEIKKGSGNVNLPSVFEADAQRQFAEKGFVVRTMSDQNSANPYFRMRVSRSQLSYDHLETGNESLQSLTVSFQRSPKDTARFAIFQSEPFDGQGEKGIEDTQCDGPKNICTPTQAAEWTKSFGFGYRLESPASVAFNGKNTFRPLFHSSEKASVLQTKLVDGAGSNASLVFKLRKSPELEEGLYNNTIIITGMSE